MIFANPLYFLSKISKGNYKSLEKAEWDKSTSQESVNEFNRI